jgi:hypothetical protein
MARFGPVRFGVVVKGGHGTVWQGQVWFDVAGDPVDKTGGVKNEK